MAFLDYDGLSLFKSNFEDHILNNNNSKAFVLNFNDVTDTTAEDWATIWNGISSLNVGETATIYLKRAALQMMSCNTREPGSLSYGGTVTRRSQTGFDFILASECIIWAIEFVTTTGDYPTDRNSAYNEKIIDSAVITEKLDKANVYNNLDKTDSGFALDARQGKALNDAKLNKTSVYNGLDKTDTGYALDATQGKALNDGKLDKTSVYNGLDKTATGFALDASQGKSLNDNKLDKTSVYNGLDKTASGFALDARQGKTLNDNKLDKTSVYNGLDKTASGFALDARQGKSLSDTLATKARYIALESTDNTWAKIWAKLNLMEAGDVATIYISNDAFDIISAGARNSGQPSGVVFRSSSTGFHFLLKNTSNNIIACTLMNVSSSSAGTYSEYMYAYANILTMSHYTGTNAISDLHTISYGQWGRATFQAAVSPTGSDVTMNYICSGSTANYKSIIAMANENFYMNTSYGSSGTWQGWKRFVSEDEVPKFSTISVANNDTFNIANNSRIKIDICASTNARCGVATFYATASGTITHNKTGASSLTFDVSTANTLKVTGASGTVNFFVTTYAGSFTKNST